MVIRKYINRGIQKRIRRKIENFAKSLNVNDVNNEPPIDLKMNEKLFENSAWFKDEKAGKHILKIRKKQEK